MTFISCIVSSHFIVLSVFSCILCFLKIIALNSFLAFHKFPLNWDLFLKNCVPLEVACFLAFSCFLGLYFDVCVTGASSNFI